MSFVNTARNYRLTIGPYIAPSTERYLATMIDFYAESSSVRKSGTCTSTKTEDRNG